MKKVEDVFGVSGKQVESYVERDDVDDKFKDALRTDKQIIIFGASKQGKTALVKKYINYDDNILISLSPKTTLKDIYKSILRKSGVTLKTSYTEGTGDSTKVNARASIQGAVALVLKGKVGVGIEKDRHDKIEDKYEEIEFNLELPDDVSDLIHRIGSKKVVILENFHYLPEAAEDIYDNFFVTFQENKQKLAKRNKSCGFCCARYTFFVPFKILVVSLLIFPFFCLVMAIYGPICK